MLCKAQLDFPQDIGKVFLCESLKEWQLQSCIKHCIHNAFSSCFETKVDIIKVYCKLFAPLFVFFIVS